MPRFLALPPRAAKAVLLASLATFSLAPIHSAFAAFAFPSGVAVGTATDQLTISGFYEPPLPNKQPFAASPFTFTVTIPTQVSVEPAPRDRAGNEFDTFSITTGDGSYSNNGQTEVFTGQNAVFGPDFNFPGQILSAASFGVSSLLGRVGDLSIGVQVNGTIVTPSNSGQLETFNPGTYVVRFGNASYSGDPPFTGTLTIAPTGPAAVPEPASLGLLAVGLLGWNAARRRRTT